MSDSFMDWWCDDEEERIMGTWGYYSYPTEPPDMTDEQWWAREAEFACEDDARPSYEELMAWEDSGYFDSEVV